MPLDEIEQLREENFRLKAKTEQVQEFAKMISRLNSEEGLTPTQLHHWVELAKLVADPDWPPYVEHQPEGPDAFKED